MKLKIIVVILVIFLSVSAYSVNYITTAESVSWNGAYTSVADGFEAMLYNPAGLFFTPTRFGMNIFGSYGMRLYSNAISTNDMLTLFRYMRAGDNLTESGILGRLLTYMPESGLDVGADASAGALMFYYKFKDFSIGASVIPKATASAVLSKGIFNTIFNELNLTEPLEFKLDAFFLSYIDYNFILSTRAKFLEKHIPVEGIYVGLATHIYLPVVFAKSNAKVIVGPGDHNPVTGFFENFNIRLKGDVIAGSNGIFSNILVNNQYIYDKTGDLFSYAGSTAFGLGLDAGFLVKINKNVRVGFSFTDLGFILFPSTATVGVDHTQALNLDEISTFYNMVIDETFGALRDGDIKYGSPTVWMPSTSIRVGVAVTPFKSGIFTWATDISLSDLNRLLIQAYPTFNFSTGIEFMPGYKFAAFPMRLAFCYNSQSNIPSFSLGFGLYLGPVEMEIGLKGLEILISGWGAKEVAAGFDLKYEF